MRPSLLLVDDDLIEARRLESALSRMGYDCTLAGDGDAALALLAAEMFDAVLLDLVLPGLDGMGVLQALRRRGNMVPVVVAVTPSGVDAAASAIRAGARDFVVKPAGALRLEVALANAVAAHRAPVAPPASNVVPFAAAAEPDPAEEALACTDPDGHVRRLDLIEADAIRFACSHYGGRLTEAARRLGIGRSTLYRKLAALGPAPLDGTAAAGRPEPFEPRIVAAE